MLLTSTFWHQPGVSTMHPPTTQIHHFLGGTQITYILGCHSHAGNFQWHLRRFLMYKATCWWIFTGSSFSWQNGEKRGVGPRHAGRNYLIAVQIGPREIRLVIVAIAFAASSMRHLVRWTFKKLICMTHAWRNHTMYNTNRWTIDKT